MDLGKNLFSPWMFHKLSRLDKYFKILPNRKLARSFFSLAPQLLKTSPTKQAGNKQLFGIVVVEHVIEPLFMRDRSFHMFIPCNAVHILLVYNAAPFAFGSAAENPIPKEMAPIICSCHDILL